MPKQPKIEEEENRPKWVNPKQQQAEVDAPKWVNPKNQQEGEEARPKWVNPKKAQGEENRPKWVNPNKGQKQERAVQPRSRQWQNPKWMSYRERMDKRLERAGLLNYQTKGLSQAEIAHRYAMAGISISDNSTWYKENYGADAPETITDRSKMFQYRSDVFAGKNPSIGAPGAGQAPTSGPIIAAGGKADRPQNFVKGANGLLVKAPNQPMGAVTDSPYAKQVFATNAQALKGEVNWADVSSTERTKLLNDPNFYKSGQITQYPAWMQQQILADPNFKWDNLPWWQKTYYELSSSPAAMGAAQGLVMGMGNPGGAVVGGVLGWAGGKSGYDPTKEFWQQARGEGAAYGGKYDPTKNNQAYGKESGNATAAAFGLMNWLAEQAEKGIGILVQSAGILTGNAEFDPKKRNLNWDAGASTFEILGPALAEGSWKNSYENMKEKIDNGEALTVRDFTRFFPGVQAVDLLLNPNEYKGEELYLGADLPVELQQNIYERMDDAKKQIEAGKPYREVMMEFQTGIVAQISDMAGQAIADPLNFVPEVSTKIGGKIAEAGGNKVAAEAFRGSDSLVEAGRKYKTLVQSGQATTIDPNFKVDQMGRLSRFVAGINDQGQVKKGNVFGATKEGILDPVRERQKNQGFMKNAKGAVADFFSQTPISRAQTGAGMFYDNVSAMLTMFKSPDEAIRYIKSVAKGDMESWANYGKQFAESPEFYTVLPALKDFDANVLDGMAQTWEMAAPNRDLLGRVADVMGDNPGSLLEDLARNGTAEQDFARLLKMAQESDSPNAKAILADIEAGRLNAATLKEMVDVFTGEGALPWHEGQWKAMMLDKMGSHFDEWVTKRLMLDKSPEAVSAFFRTSALLKQAQSILLLGGSPGYAITNGLSNMVHRAVSGVFGYMTGKQIDSFMDRMGMKPARLEEGVGIGGVVDSSSSLRSAQSGGMKTTAMDAAVRGKGAITTAKDMLSKLSKGMPFNKVSSFFEKGEGRRAFAIGMKDFWSQSWRRGVGFREMSPELVKVMGEMGMDQQRVYAAIEAGMNQTEIEKALMGRQTEVQARGLIHDAAQKTGMTASEAATMLERTGVLDTLDKFLAGQTTREGVAGAFRRAESVAQDWMDMKMGEDLKAKAENVKQRVGLEGAAAALDVAQKAHGEFTDAWLDHYHRFGEVMQDLQMLDDPLMKDKAIDQAYNISDREFRRVFANNAANYKGIFEAWGMSGDVKALRVLESIGEVDNAMAGAYRSMRENIRAWREAWAGDLKNPQRWDEWNKVQAQNEAAFKKGFKAKHEAEVKQGAALGEVYESLYGPAAGEAARLWWEDVVKFGDEITRQENEFRQGVKDARAAGALAEDIAAEKQKYYSEKKPVMIAELEKINNEGIARLERVIKGRGTSNEGGVPVAPKGPEGGPSTEVTGQRSQVEGLTGEAQDILNKIDKGGAMPAFVTNNLKRIAAENGVTVTAEMNAQNVVDALREKNQPKPVESGKPASASEKTATASRVDRVEELNALMAAAEQRKGRAAAEAEGRKAAVWDVAEEYWGKGGNYNRGILQDGFALVAELKKPEYGGIPDLTWLDDPRLTPELARQILETRKAAKEAAGVAAADKAFKVTDQKKSRKFDTSQINQDTSILRAIALHGGIDLKLAKDLTGEVKPKSAPGVFTRKGGMKGYGIDEMARLLANDGYPIRLDDVNDPGGIQQTTDLINRARAGEKVYPMGHSFDAEISAAEQAWIDGFNFDETPEVPFDSALWQSEFDTAVRGADLGRVYELIGDVPEEQLSVINDQWGGTWRDYLSKTADEVAARVSEDATMERVAGKAAEVEQVLADAEYHAEAVTKRAMVLEGMAEAFGLNEKETAAYGEMNDAVAEWYARQTGEGVDDFYNRYFGEARRGVPGAGDQVPGDGLMQGGVGPVWYSKLTQTVEAINQPKMSVEQLKGAITKAGVKADELKWMGFDEWMSGKKSVTKAEALEFLRENQVQVQEVVKGNQEPFGVADVVGFREDQVMLYVKFSNGREQPLNKYSLDLPTGKPTVLTDDIKQKAVSRFNENLGKEGRAPTKFSQYTLPGGENYREVLFTLPYKKITELPADVVIKENEFGSVPEDKYLAIQGEEVIGYGETPDAAKAYALKFLSDYGTKQSNQNTFRSGHWSEPNVLAHVRLNDRVDVDGKRVLFVEEVQSDWHQAGREKGYKGGEDRTKLPDGYRIEERTNQEGIYYRVYDRSNDVVTSSNTAEDALARAWKNADADGLGGVPQAPFSKTWHEMTMKRVLRMAAEDGYDRVAWTTGEQQAARYDLAKQVDRINYRSDGTLEGIKGSQTVFSQKVSEAELAGAIGKDAAAKLVNQKPDPMTGMKAIKGDDLAVGGEGMKGFYDQILPAFMDKYGKKWGVKKGETSFDFGKAHSIDVTPEMRESVMGGQPLFQRETGMLPGMDEPMGPGDQGLLFGMQLGQGGSRTKMDAGAARSIADIDPNRTAVDGAGVELARGDIVVDGSGNRYNVAGANMRGEVITQDGKVLKGASVTRVASQPDMFGATRPADEGRIPGTFDKGMVTFEGVKGTITAFEAADFSTVIHETGHIYRRMLADVAERTKNPYVLRDLTTIEEWAGVKDGNWTRDAEEKFARGFERYVTEGNAPTPKLKAAFESFRTWMLEIYKTITGSSIDVKLTDEVKRVFDRMLGAENLRLDLDNQLKQMNYDPKLWYVDPLGNIVKRPEFKLEIDQGKAARDVAAMDIEGMRARVEALRQRAAAGEIKPGPDISRTSWTTDQPELVKQIRDERNPANWKSWASVEEAPVGRESVRALTDWTLGKMKEGSRSQVEGPAALFQSESIPFGMYDEQGGFRASGDGLDALWREKVSPLLRAMEEGATSQVSGVRFGEGAARDMSPDGQAMLKKYMEQVKGDMATAKLATVRYAEKTRDFALLNYSKRYGFDRYADAVMPYQFYMSRSGINWAARMLDKPALYSNYARLRMQQERYERDIPERMRGKIKINAPWLPEWAGDGLYIDPMRNLFFPDTIMRAFERKQQDKNYQVIEAERVLQEWQAGGQYSDKEIIDAAKTQQGKVWDRAWAEAQIRRESDTANPVDFFTSFFGPAWYLSTPLNLAGVKVTGISKGDPNKVNTTPLGNTARALDTVTQGTWAEPFGDLVGLIGKAEDKAREAFKLPTRGEYAEYYTKRQVANMVAEGKITSEQAQIAMIEKSGPYWDEAKQRVDMELALRVPLAGVTYAALHGGPKAAAQAAVPSLFGASLLPAGELEFRGLKQEWNEAWKLADAGDTKAVSRFFDNHPEYEAYLAKNKDDGELLKSFLIGSVWDAYMEMGTTNQKQARAELGEAFQQSFLDKETRSYETLTTEQLAAWTQLLGKYVPTPAGQGQVSGVTGQVPGQDKMRLYPEQVTAITDQYFEQRSEKFPNYYTEQSGYYALPKSERKAYLREHPNLKAYWDWKDRWYTSYPEYVPIFNGFDRVDTSGWMPGLEESVREAAMAGDSLPDGARAALMNEWMLGGQPMGNFDTWVTSVVMPGMLYGN